MAKNSGFTLIEVLVSMTVATILMAAIFLSYQVQVAAKISQENTLDRNQEARAGLELMASDIRMAGCNPTGTLTTAEDGFITGPTTHPISTTAFTVTMDFLCPKDPSAIPPAPNGNQGDGQIDEPGEQVTYYFDSSNHELMRQLYNNGDGSAQTAVPLVRHVDAVNFVYLNEYNNALDPSVASNLPLIRSVQISMVVRADKVHRGLLPSYIDNTIYKNLQGTTIFTPPNGDTFRRTEFSTTVQCRNMGVND